MIAEGDYVAQYLRTSGTHTCPLAGIPATGKKTSVTGVVISKFKDREVVETRSLWDQLSLMQQLGVIPTPIPSMATQDQGVRHCETGHPASG